MRSQRASLSSIEPVTHHALRDLGEQSLRVAPQNSIKATAVLKLLLERIHPHPHGIACDLEDRGQRYALHAQKSRQANHALIADCGDVDRTLVITRSGQ